MELRIGPSPDSTESGSTESSKDHLILVEEEEFGSLKALKRLFTSFDFSQATMWPRRGHRAVEAWLRPAPIYTNGRLESYTFDLKKCTFTMRLTANQVEPHTPSEIYLPEYHFPMGDTSVSVSGGEWEISVQDFHTVKLQYLRWWHGDGALEIKIKKTKRVSREYAALRQHRWSQCMMM
jgi:hypothetical protein